MAKQSRFPLSTARPKSRLDDDIIKDVKPSTVMMDFRESTDGGIILKTDTMISLTGSGIIVSALVLLLKHFGVVVEADSVVSFVTNVVQAAGFVMVVVGQLRRRDLSYGIIRK